MKWIVLFIMLLGLYGCKVMDIVDEEGSQKTVDLTAVRQSVILSADERTLFVNVGNLGLDIFDVTDPGQPKLLKNYATDGYTYALALSGNTLFLANGSEGVELLDVSVADVPRRVAYIRTGDDNATSVALLADTQTLAIGTGQGVQLFDVTHQSVPGYLGRYESNGTVRDLQFCHGGKDLCLANSAYGFELLDATVPSRPELLGGVALEGNSIDVGSDHTGDNIYISTLTSALKKIDLTDPRQPEYSVFYDAHDAGIIWSFAFGATDQRLYLARDRAGLEIVTVGTDGVAHHLSSFDTNGTARGVAVNRAETIAFVADGSEGLKVIDISDKSRPKRTGYAPF